MEDNRIGMPDWASCALGTLDVTACLPGTCTSTLAFVPGELDDS